MSKFLIYEKTGWRWKLVANNGETVANSEPYSSRASAIRGAENVKSIAPQSQIEG